MASIDIKRLGPGQLAFGAPGDAQEFGTRVKSAKLTPEVEEGDELTVLSGDTVTDESDVKWTLEGDLYDDYSAESLAIWCLENNGERLTFTFKPRTDQVLTASGNAIIRPIGIGGEVKERNTNSFKFTCTDVKLNAAG